MTCKVPMSVFTSSPYSLSYGTLVVARGSATNNYGTSTSSSPNTFGATVETQPLQMTAPYMMSRWNTSIMIGWNSETGSNTGGSSILNYTLYSDQGSGGVSYVIVYQGLNTDFNVTGLTPNTQYGFIIQATNIYGSSPNSTVALIYTL